MNGAFDQHEFAGYSEIEPLYIGSRTLVYRAVRTRDRMPVVLKRLRTQTPTLEEQAQFRNQYTIVQGLDIPGTVRVIGLEPSQTGDILVMESFNGVPLSKYLEEKKQNHQFVEISEFLSIAVQLSITLKALHQAKILHKDVKPSNILIHPSSGQVRLIDFSIASKLSQHTQELTHPNQLEGTLAYLSPEQTGRMNRTIDYRSDFYSLGITFYELLTGKLPFAGEDALELVYCHLAKEPTPMQALRADIPDAIAQIVSKLMSKNAEDRYQSASGLQADLQHCLEAIKTIGSVSAFDIGKLDRMAQLNIPEKLYGRENQIQQLLAAFERVRQGGCELVVIAGYSGIGKTALIQELFKPVTESQGHFISGKFDQFKRDIPYACLAEAYGKLIRQILSDSQEQVEYWRDRFLTALGQNGQIIINVIPEMELLIGQQPALPELPPAEAQNRFHQTFIAFTQAAASPDAPLVEFMDDLQWVDATTIAGLPVALSNPEKRYHLSIVAYRDNEVDAMHPFMQALSQLQAEGFKFEHITLEPLSLHDVMQLVADTLGAHFSTVQPLAKLLYEKTQGNPFFLTQLIKSLHSEGLITFNFETGRWQWDILQIQQQNITDNVVELMIAKLQKLSEQTQLKLELAACIGNQFDLKTLSIVTKQSPSQTLQTLWDAIEQGFIVPLDQHYHHFLNGAEDLDADSHNPRFKFLHDRVQQAAYELIAEDQKQATHLAIARLLLQNTPETELESNIFEIVNHWNQAISLAQLESDRVQLAELNLVAGRKAKASIAYESAFKYLDYGLSLLAENSWQDHYDLTLALHTEATAVSFLKTDFEQSKQLSDLTLKYAKNLLDKVAVYEVQILSYTAQNQLTSAIETTLQVLELLNVPLEDQAPKDLVIDDLDRLPEMTDPYKLAAMKFLVNSYAPLIMAAPDLLPKLVFTAIKLCIQFGNSAMAPASYVFYGMLLIHAEDLHTAYQFGELAVRLLNRFDARPYYCVVQTMFNIVLRHWKDPIRETIQPVRNAIQVGLETGDSFYTSCLAKDGCTNLFLAGENLQIVAQHQTQSLQVLQKLKQQYALYYAAIWHQVVLNLQGQAENPLELTGDSFNEAQLLPKLEQEQNQALLFTFYVAKGLLLYLLKDYKNSVVCNSLASKYAASGASMATVPTHNFFQSLALLAHYQSHSPEHLQQVRNNQEKMAYWAKHAPQNFSHKFDLVEAEIYSVLEQNYEAMEYYDLAIAGALENGYQQEAALASELAAKFYFNLNKPKIAQTYLLDAYHHYEQWGAIAKVKQLEQQYADYLAFNSAASGLNLTTQTRGSTSTSSNYLDIATVLKAAEAISSELVLDKLLDRLLHIILENTGAQKGCIVLEREDELFIEVADTNQGESEVIVESISLVESQNVPLTVLQYVARTQQAIVSANASSESICLADPYVLKHRPKSLLCAPILYQSKFIGLVYLENNLVSGSFTNDRLEIVQILTGQAAIAIENAKLYVREKEKSQQLAQLNFMLKAQQEAELDGILVIDQHRQISSFNRQFVEMWNIPSDIARLNDDHKMLGHVLSQLSDPQAFITKVESLYDSIESVRDEIGFKDGRTIERYTSPVLSDTNQILGRIWCFRDISDRKSAELLAQQKTQELEQALIQLQQSQSQVVQAEKMSALGNLVAGVAHEINNPIGFLNGSINNARDYVQDLLGHLDLYQQHCAKAPNLIQDNAEDIDLEFLRDDLPKLLNSMKGATDRIKAISTSLRTFSRADTEHTISANIHEGIDSTILILKYRLKANEHRPAIEIVTNYGNIPNLDCFPGQLNQVFMNILANAIDMFDEVAQQSSFYELEADPQTITIQTEQTDCNRVEIRIRDNGKGMPEAVKAKIFDHLFTTKAVGKGTGLGLAIARQIIVEKHQGTLEVNSAIGQGTEFIISLPIE